MSPVPSPSSPRGSGLLPPIDAHAVPRAVSPEREMAVGRSSHPPRSRVRARREMFGLPRTMVLAGAGVLVALVLGLALLYASAPDHNRVYWEQYRALDPAASDFGARMQQLPIHKVNDAELRAYHYDLMEDLDLSRRARKGETSVLPALVEIEMRLDRQRAALHERYE